MKLKKTLLSRPFRPWSYPLVSAVLLGFLFLSSFYWQGSGSFLTASREEVFSGHQYWKLITTIGVHADVRHYFSNAIFFFIFGFLLNSYFGALWFPVLSLGVGAFVNYLTLALYPPHSVLLGASGVVYLMAGAWATLFVFIERKAHPLKRVMAAIGVSTMLFFPTRYEPEISYLAHGLGFLAGIMTALTYFFFAKDKIRAAEVWEAKDRLEEEGFEEADLIRVIHPENLDFDSRTLVSEVKLDSNDSPAALSDSKCRLC